MKTINTKFFGAFKKIFQWYVNLVNDWLRWNCRCSGDNDQLHSFRDYIQNGGLSKDKWFLDNVRKLVWKKCIHNSFDYNSIRPSYVYAGFFDDFEEFVENFLDGECAKYMFKDFLDYVNVLQECVKVLGK